MTNQAAVTLLDNSTMRYLSSADVCSAFPPIERQLQLAEEALRAIVDGSVEMPPKTAVHPRDEAFLHAMPAWIKTSDTVGLKWVSGFPENRSHGLPYIMGLMVLNDVETGKPVCVMDAAELTARRTAAVSGVFIDHFAPRGARRVAIIGTGVQARSHLPVLLSLIPDLELVVCDAIPEAAQRFAQWAEGQNGVASVRVAATVPETVADADVVLTAGTKYAYFQNQITRDLLKKDALIVAIDWSTLVPGNLVHEAALFVVDDVPQYLYHKSLGVEFIGYPDEALALGSFLDSGETGERRPSGLIIAMPLGIAAADLIFARAILANASESDLGQQLPL